MVTSAYYSKDMASLRRIWKSQPFSSSLLKFGFMPRIRLSMYPKIIDDVGYYNDDFDISGDYDWMLRILLNLGSW